MLLPWGKISATWAPIYIDLYSSCASSRKKHGTVGAKFISYDFRKIISAGG